VRSLNTCEEQGLLKKEFIQIEDIFELWKELRPEMPLEDGLLQKCFNLPTELQWQTVVETNGSPLRNGTFWKAIQQPVNGPRGELWSMKAWWIVVSIIEALLSYFFESFTIAGISDRNLGQSAICRRLRKILMQSL
jgi:hypothetical protein